MNIFRLVILLSTITAVVDAFLSSANHCQTLQRPSPTKAALASSSTADATARRKVVIIGAGWGGLSAAHSLAKANRRNLTNKENSPLEITLVDSSPRVGGLVRDGYSSSKGTRSAEAGQHGFWNNYRNIFRFLEDDLLPSINDNGDLHSDAATKSKTLDDLLTDYAPQGQYSKRKGLEAIWPVYRRSLPRLPTGLAQAFHTKFLHLPLIDRLSAFPLVLAFSDFDDTHPSSWKKYDSISFRDLCIKLGVSERCYREAFEPMVLTGLFAPGKECSAAAALGMAYFFVLRSQNSFDVRWCRGNIGEVIMDPWVELLKKGHDAGDDRAGVDIRGNTKVVGFETVTAKGSDGSKTGANDKISRVICLDQKSGEEFALEADEVVFAIGAAALNGITRNSPQLCEYEEFRRFTNLRGTSVLATRVYLDRKIKIPYSANACFGFDEGIGMTMFDISTLHSNPNNNKSKTDNDDDQQYTTGSIIEVDYYHANPLLVQSDEAIIQKVKNDLDTILGTSSQNANIVDSAIVRLPNAVNWYFPGSHSSMPDVRSASLSNVYFAGDLVKTNHGSWSQEKAFVTGMEAANLILGRRKDDGIIGLGGEEVHVDIGRRAVGLFRKLLRRDEEKGGVGALPLLGNFLRQLMRVHFIGFRQDSSCGKLHANEHDSNQHYAKVENLCQFFGRDCDHLVSNLEGVLPSFFVSAERKLTKIRGLRSTVFYEPQNAK